MFFSRVCKRKTHLSAHDCALPEVHCFARENSPAPRYLRLVGYLGCFSGGTRYFQSPLHLFYRYVSESLPGYSGSHALIHQFTPPRTDTPSSWRALVLVLDSIYIAHTATPLGSVHSVPPIRLASHGPKQEYLCLIPPGLCSSSSTYTYIKQHQKTPTTASIAKDPPGRPCTRNRFYVYTYNTSTRGSP